MTSSKPPENVGDGIFLWESDGGMFLWKTDGVHLSPPIFLTARTQANIVATLSQNLSRWDDGHTHRKK